MMPLMMPYLEAIGKKYRDPEPIRDLGILRPKRMSLSNLSPAQGFREPCRRRVRKSMRVKGDTEYQVNKT